MRNILKLLRQKTIILKHLIKFRLLMLIPIFKDEKKILLLPIIGFSFQLVMWWILINIIVAVPVNYTFGFINFLGSLLLFLPILSLIGIFFSLWNIYEGKKIVYNFLGLVLNLLWLVFLGLSIIIAFMISSV